MRVVVDTNVLISAVLKEQSLPALAVRLAQRRDLLLKSVETERELRDVIGRSRIARFIAPNARAWLLKLSTEAEQVTIVERIAECRDAKDDKFLELAVNGGADVILSGDKDLLVLSRFRGIPIISPADFMRMNAG